MAAAENKSPDGIELRERADAEASLPPTKEAAVDAEARGQGLAGYEDLTILQTLKVFRRNAIVCMAMALSAATDGYQIG